jgi:hypothetical protein
VHAVAIVPVVSAAAASVAAMPAVLQVGDQVLAAASCGTRETLWIDHYVATLYVPPGDAADAALLDARRPKALEIRLLSKTFMPTDIPRKYRRALEAEFADEAMERWRDAYGALRAGDVVRITYAPEAGVSMSVNGRPIVVSPAHRLVESILLTWADGKPLDRHLRTVLARHPCPTVTTG